MMPVSPDMQGGASAKLFMSTYFHILAYKHYINENLPRQTPEPDEIGRYKGYLRWCFFSVRDFRATALYFRHFMISKASLSMPSIQRGRLFRRLNEKYRKNKEEPIFSFKSVLTFKNIFLKSLK